MQWIFHYKEILKYKNMEFESELNKFKAENKVLRNEVTTICEHLELMGAIINPEAGKRYMEYKKLAEAKKEIKEENFAEDWKTLKETIPNKIFAKTPWVDNKIIPKREKKQKPSISFNIKGGE